MISIGLMPSATGKPDGNVVGQHMADYPASTGRFIKSCENLLKVKELSLPWVDRFSREADIQQDTEILEILNEALEDFLLRIHLLTP